MGRPFSRLRDVRRIHYFLPRPGARAVFLVEVRTRKEARQVRELFDMVGRLAEVVPISHGAVMSYAVLATADPSLLGKIEWLLKTQFTFSLMERSLTSMTFRILRNLCEESDARLEELPECGICRSVDPFPTRVIVHLADESEPLHRAYCARCAGDCSPAEADARVRALVARDVAGLRVRPETEVSALPEMAERKPGWRRGALAAAG